MRLVAGLCPDPPRELIQSAPRPSRWIEGEAKKREHGSVKKGRKDGRGRGRKGEEGKRKTV